MKHLLRTTVALLLWAVAATVAAQGVDISNQQTRSFVLAAQSFSNVFEFTLPAGTTRFKVTLTGVASVPAADADVDLFLRFGRPFPRSSNNDYGAGPTTDELFEYAHYHSISAELNESITVSTAGRIPAQGGKWFISLLNFSSTAASNATLKLDILNGETGPAPINVRFDLGCRPGQTSCTCDLTPWNDPRTTGFAAPGNLGVTLGEKRRNAVLEAARQFSQSLRSEAPITVQACWDNLGAGDRVTLAQAGPTNFLIDDKSFVQANGTAFAAARPAGFLPNRNTWFAAAIATKTNGAAACQTFGGACNQTADIVITFNSLIDTADALGTRNFYYGTQASGNTASEPDFVSVALHEMTHGMGYVSLLNLSPDGAEALGEEAADRDDIFTRQVVDLSTGSARAMARLSDPERAAALTADRLQWVGQRTLSSPEFTAINGELGVPMHAPSPLEPGSSLSHLSSNRFATQLMLPFISRTRALGIAANQLEDMGWDPRAKSMPVLPKIYAGNWFDPRQSSHGFDLQPAGTINGYQRLLLTAYTFDLQGDPEYFLAQGPLVDGVFTPEATAQGQSLVRYRYVNARPVVDPNTQGYVRIDFNEGNISKACTEPGFSAPAPGATANAGSLVFVANNRAVNWCIQPLIPQEQRPVSDFSGHWYSPDDSGWGLGIAQALINGKVITLAIVYYPDALGNPRWALAQSDDFRTGQTIPIKHRRGFCRGCPRAIEDIDAGQMTLSFGNADGLVGQPNRISFDVEFKGAAGGRFSRSNAPLVRLVPKPAVVE